MIYFVQCNGVDGPVKIGWVKNQNCLANRLISMQRDCPYTLRIVGIRNGSRKLEHRIHFHFEPSHVRGEWFNCTHALKAYIKHRCLGGGAFNCMRKKASKLKKKPLLEAERLNTFLRSDALKQYHNEINFSKEGSHVSY